MSGNKVDKHVNILKSQNEWLSEITEEDGVSESFVIRRAIAYYQKEGKDKDKFYKAQTEGNV